MISELLSSVFWIYFSYVLSFIVPLFCGLTLLLIKGQRTNTKTGIHPRYVLGIIFTLTGLLFIPNMLQNIYLLKTGKEVLPAFDIATHLLLIPLYFLYFKKLTTPERLNSKSILFYLLPAIIIFIIGTLILPNEEDVSVNPSDSIESIWSLSHLFRYFCLFLQGLFILFYCIYILKLKKRYLQQIEESFSFVDGINLEWVSHAILLSILYGAIALLSMINTEPWTDHLHNICSLFFVFYLFIHALNEPYICYSTFYTNPQPQVVTSQQKTAVETPCPNSSQDETISPIFPPQPEHYLKILGTKKDKLRDELTRLFEQKKVFTRSTLTIHEVADMMNTNRTYISNIINNEFGLSFYQFVNKYRIQEATILFLEHPEMPVQEVASLVGFNSISSFITAFKINQGITPKQWKQLYTTKRRS